MPVIPACDELDIAQGEDDLLGRISYSANKWKAPMSGFDDREKSFENKYKRDQETLFRITSRRNRLLGLWAAEKFGLPDNQALDYAKEVVLADFEEPGDEDVVRKVLADFAERGIDMDEKGLRKEMIRLMDEAGRQIEEENS